MPDISKFPRGVPGRDLRSNIAPFAQWADPKFIAQHPFWQYQPGKIFLGRIGEKLIGVSDDRHMQLLAGTRAGKGVSAIIPNLLEYPGSIICTDPKGENARITYSRRGQGSKFVKQSLGQEVHAFDPFGVSGHPCASFNCISMIDPASELCVDDAALIADGLIIQEHGGGSEAHFNAAARNFFRGLVLYVSTEEREDLRNLLYLRHLVTLDDRRFDTLLHDMQADDRCFGVIQRAANSMLGKADNEKSGVRSTCIEQTDWLDSPALARCLAKSDFQLADLKRKPMTIYLSLPFGRMATHSRLWRIIINLALEAMERETIKPALPVIFLLDEMATLDHMASLEKGAGQLAGLSVKLWPITQDLSQLKIYKSWETFLGNAGLIQAFGNADLTTLEHLSKRLGKSTIMQVSQGEISVSQSAGGFTGESVNLHTVELMTSDEIARHFSRQSGNQLLLWPGSDPIAIERVRYFDDPFFAGKFDP
jgi:type IV secretion system protein VirD4